MEARRQSGAEPLQRQAGREWQPLGFALGTPDLRGYVRGYEQGQISACDIFAAERL
ncbi:MAG: hypothetical protein WEB56_03785 [Roseovarius sp.]